MVIKSAYSMISKYKSLYRMMLKIKPPVSSFKFYSSLMLGFADFFAHCKDLTSSIIEHGTAVTIPDSALKMRKSLGLPPPKFDEVDIKRLAILTGLSKILEKYK